MIGRFILSTTQKSLTTTDIMIADGSSKPERGSRKLKHAREQSLILFCGFIFAVWCKAPSELFVGFVGGLATVSGAFVYGNAKEHQANAASITNQAKVTP